MKLRYLAYFILPLAVACTSEATYPDAIALRAGFGSFDTKAASAQAYTDSIPSSDNPLKADVWFSTVKDTYKGTGGVNQDGTSIDVHTTITYYGPTITVPDPYSGDNYVHYPPYHGTVYCVGFYPQGKWRVSGDGKSATADIDGNTDLMYANQKDGSDDSSFTRSRQLYNHELTWLKVRVYSRKMAAGDTWGKIRKISVASANSAKVTFATDAVEYSGSTKIVAYESAGEIIPTTSTEFGSIMVSPTTEGKYIVDIECENYSKTGVEVNLTDSDGNAFTGTTKGQVFVLTLYFQALPSVDFSAMLSGWEDEVQSLVLE